MECFLASIVLMAVIIGLVIFASRGQTRSSRWNEAYRDVARRYGGTSTAGGWFRRPSVRFRYGATHVLLGSEITSGVEYTQALISWPDHDFRCEIYPERVYSLASPFGGMQHVKTGSEDFDRSYEIHSNSDSEVRALLSDAVRWQIEKLRRFRRNDDIFIAISHGRIAIKKPAPLRSYEELDEFVQLALELYDQAMLTRSVGIEFVNEDKIQPITEAICQVCGENISTEMVFCRRCKTPHHLDCWHYYGSCTTYGCQETQFVTPGVATGHNDEPFDKRPKPR